MKVKFKHKVEKAKGACLHPKNVISQLLNLKENVLLVNDNNKAKRYEKPS